MSTSITTRQTAGTGATVKGAPLTNAEVDANFINLNAAAQPAGGTGGQVLAKVDGADFNSQWIDNYATALKFAAKNTTAGTLTKGTVVYVSGGAGANPYIAPADASAEGTSATTVGIIEADVAVNGFVNVVRYGALTGVDTAAAADGDPVWLSGSVAGGMVFGLANKPVAPNHLVYLGTVTRAHAVNGEIQVSVSNGWELSELHDVAITSAAGGDFLVRDGATSLWKNAAPAAARATLSISNVEDKSSATIRGELTSSNVTTALGYTPLSNATSYLPLSGGTLSGSIVIAPMGVAVAASSDTFLHLAGDSTKRRLLIDSTSVSGPVILGRQANGTQLAPTATQATNTLLFIDAAGHNGSTGYNAFSGYFKIVASENFSTTAAGTELQFGVTANGTLTPYVGMTLSNAGALNTVGAITQNGNQVLHAGNYGTYTRNPGGFAAASTGTGTSAHWYKVFTWQFSSIYTNIGLRFNVVTRGNQDQSLYELALSAEWNGSNSFYGVTLNTQSANALPSGHAWKLVGDPTTGVLSLYINRSASDWDEIVLFKNSQFYTGVTETYYNSDFGTTAPTGAASYNGTHRIILHSGNYTSYALPLSGGTLTGNLTVSANIDFTGAGSVLPGHFYTHDHDGTNVYFHVGQSGSTTNKVLNLRVFRDNGDVGLHQFTPDAYSINGQPVLHSGNSKDYKSRSLNAVRTTNVDFNSLNTAVDTFTAGTNYIPSGGAYNQPADGDHHYLSWGGIEGQNVWGAQIDINFYDDRMWFRRQAGANWQAWRNVLHDGNYNSYSPTLTGGGASGTWGISISGNAATAGGLYPSQFFNNMGSGHSTYTDFNTAMSSGANYLQGGTNGPTGTSSHQFYGFKLGLGSDYDPASQYASQLYWARQNQGGGEYLWARDMEGGSWGSWRKMAAGYADNAGLLDSLDSSDFARAVPRQSGADLNNFLTSGAYGVNYDNYNRPGDWGGVLVAKSADVIAQWYGDHENNFWVRGGNPPNAGGGGVWNSWQKLLHSGNYSSYALPLNSSFTTAVNAVVPFTFRKTSDSTDNGATLLVQNDSGTHSWGITAEFRVNASTGDRPSILFSSGATSTTWSVGFGGYDDQFRIKQNHGHRNGDWGTERFRIDTGGTPYFNGNVALHAGNYTSYSPSLTGSGASGTWGINITGSAGSAGWSTYSQILDTRAGQYSPNAYEDYRTTFEFTDQIVGGDWHTAMTMQGWHNGYAAWQIIGPASTSAHENWYLRSGVNTSWNSARAILHSGNFSSYALPLSGGTVTGSTLFHRNNPDINNGSYGVGNNHIELRTDNGSNPALGFHRSGYTAVTLYHDTNNSLRLRDANTGADSLMLHSGNYNSFALGILGDTFSISNWNDLTAFGSRRTAPDGADTNGPPINQYGNLLTFGHGDGVTQMQAGHDGRLAWRTKWNASDWTGWQTALDSGNYSGYALPLSGGTLSGAITVNGGSNSIIAQDNGGSGDWRGRIISRNSTYDRAAFLGVANGNTGVFAHNHALNAWAPLYVNTSDIGSFGGAVVFSRLQMDADGTDTWYRAQSGNRHRFTTTGGADFIIGNFSGVATLNGNQVLHAGNYTSYSPSLTGSGASGTWSINISGNAAEATRASGQGGYPHAGYGMYAFYNWGGNNGGASAPSESSYTVGLSVGSHPSDQAYGFQIARNMWNTGLWTRGYDSGWGSWVRLLDSSNYSSYALPLSGGTVSGYTTFDGGLSAGTGGGQRLYVYRSGTVRQGFGVDITGNSYESDWFGSAGPSNQGRLSLGFVSHSDGTTFSEIFRVNAGGGVNVLSGDLNINSSDGNIVFANSGTTKRGIIGTMGDNDQWFIGGGATASNVGYLEIATGDDGQGAGSAEPIYVSQYGPGNPVSGTLFRRATLLDASGNTSFPGALSTAGSITATAFYYSSDERKKKNIAKIESALSKLRKIGGVEFDWLDSGAHDAGVIAQRVKEHFSPGVGGTEDDLKVNTQAMIGLLFAAVAELSDIVLGDGL